MAQELVRPMSVVFTPDLVGAALVDSFCGEVLEQWRDGQLLPVVNRSLLMSYFRLLRGLGGTEVLIRRWGWWFTSRDHALFQPGETSTAVNGMRQCEELARAGQAEWIICSGRKFYPAPKEPSDGASWITAEAFVERRGE